MTDWPQHIAASTCHVRRTRKGGDPQNAFRYGVDYVLIDPNSDQGPWLFSRNKRNLASVQDRDHGGAPGKGRGADWAAQIFADKGIKDVRILLLAQPRAFGYIFNPVSFWLAMQGDVLCAAIAEVTNTYGDRHSYICAKPDLSPITRSDRVTTQKLMHVSPFQDVAGDYTFSFHITPKKLAIRIDFRDAGQGLIATLSGARAPLTNRAILVALMRRPLGAMRTMTLIHWQALRLKLMGAVFRPRPKPPNQEVS